MSDDTGAADPDVAPETPAPDSPPAPPRPAARCRRIALIGGAAAVAVAAVASVLVVTLPHGSRYAVPKDACALVSPATVARYLPGKENSHRAAGGCQWFGDTGTGDGLAVFVSVLGGATEAGGDFTEVVRFSEQKTTANGETQNVTGKRAVTGLGDQATALFGFISGGPLGDTRVGSVLLVVRSDNAVIQVLRNTGTPRGAAPLPGAVAIAREVLAALPRS